MRSLPSLVKHIVKPIILLMFLLGAASGAHAAFSHRSPFQIAPIAMHRPGFNNSIGWHYTFGACKSNFLDCLFLPHSPCPRIALDLWQPGSARIEPARFHPDQRPRLLENPVWYGEALGLQNGQHPYQLHKHWLLGIQKVPSQQAIVAQFLRPQLGIREEIQRMSSSLPLQMGTCAAMHVRRGDILLDGNFR